MRKELFAECSDGQHHSEIKCFLQQQESTPGDVGNRASFVAETSAGLVGFVEVMIRSHAEGCWEYCANGQMGVAHLEALWVHPNSRNTGVARKLVRECEQWTLSEGLAQLASDAELVNIASQRTHEALGFKEVERAVHFVKAIPKHDYPVQ